MRKIILVTLMLIFLCGVCSAESRYRLIHQDNDTTTSFDIQTATYTYAGNFVIADVWTKREYSDSGVEKAINERKELGLFVNGFENLKYSMVHNVYTNRPPRVRLLEIICYDKNNKVIDRAYFSENESKWEDIVPATIGEKEKNAVFNYDLDRILSGEKKIK